MIRYTTFKIALQIRSKANPIIRDVESADFEYNTLPLSHIFKLEKSLSKKYLFKITLQNCQFRDAESTDLSVDSDSRVDKIVRDPDSGSRLWP